MGTSCFIYFFLLLLNEHPHCCFGLVVLFFFNLRNQNVLQLADEASGFHRTSTHVDLNLVSIEPHCHVITSPPYHLLSMSPKHKNSNLLTFLPLPIKAVNRDVLVSFNATSLPPFSFTITILSVLRSSKLTLFLFSHLLHFSTCLLNCLLLRNSARKSTFGDMTPHCIPSNRMLLLHFTLCERLTPLIVSRSRFGPSCYLLLFYFFGPQYKRSSQ